MSDKERSGGMNETPEGEMGIEGNGRSDNGWEGDESVMTKKCSLPFPPLVSFSNILNPSGSLHSSISYQLSSQKVSSLTDNLRSLWILG